MAATKQVTYTEYFTLAKLARRFLEENEINGSVDDVRIEVVECHNSHASVLRISWSGPFPNGD